MKNIPTRDELFNLYIVNGWNMEKLSIKYDTYRAAISKLLKKYNIKIRDPHEKKKSPAKDVLCNMYKTMTMLEMCKKLSVSERILSKWFKGHQIDTLNITDRKYEIPKKDLLIKYYSDDNLTLKQISVIFNVSNETARRWFIHYDIEVMSNIKKFSHLRAVPFTKKQKEFVIGTLLGDGYIGGKKSKRLNLSHCDRQLDYILYKKQIISNFVNLMYRIDRIDKRTKTRYLGWSFTSICHPALTKIHKMFYVNNKKIVPKDISNYLTPFALSFLIMDDGWKNNKTSIRISTEGFTKQDNNILLFAIKTNFNIIGKVCEYTRNNKKYYYISFNKVNSIKLSNLIEPYFVDCMKYKLIRSSETKRQTSHVDEDIVRTAQ